MDDDLHVINEYKYVFRENTFYHKKISCKKSIHDGHVYYVSISMLDPKEHMCCNNAGIFCLMEDFLDKIYENSVMYSINTTFDDFISIIKKIDSDTWDRRKVQLQAQGNCNEDLLSWIEDQKHIFDSSKILVDDNLL